MAIRTQEELLNSIKGLLKDDASDESIGLLEDVTDTFESMSKNKDEETYKTKYEEKVQEVEDWRKKYRDRFFNTGSKDEKTFEPESEPEPVKKKFEDLFSIKE